MRKTGILLAFIDTLICLLVYVLFAVHPIASKQAASKPAADYTIWCSWETGLAVDIDQWLRLPNGTSIAYNRKDIGYATLERDDLGVIAANGKVNLEITSLREPPDGEYGLSIHTYSTAQPISGNITVEITNSTGIIVFSRVVPMPPNGRQQGIAVFSIINGQIEGARNTELTFRG